MITEESPLHRRTLRELRSGDVLLMQGPPARTAALKSEPGLLVLDGTLDLPRTRKAPITILIMAAVVSLAAFRVLPVAMSSLLGVLAAVMIFLGVLTNFVSNNAAAAVGTPVALSIAQQIGAPLEPFVLAAIVGCNLSFATPMGYQTNVLIMQPGGYVFRDFMRVGGPLVVLMIVAFSIELTSYYPMEASATPGGTAPAPDASAAATQRAGTTIGSIS